MLEKTLQVNGLLLRKSIRGTLNEYEAQLLESCSVYLTSVLKLANLEIQKNLLVTERELDELRNSDDVSP